MSYAGAGHQEARGACSGENEDLVELPGGGQPNTTASRTCQYDGRRAFAGEPLHAMRVCVCAPCGKAQHAAATFNLR